MAVLREVAGFVLLGAGVIGILVPVIPGIPLLLVGGLILAPKYPRIRGMIQRIRRWTTWAGEAVQNSRFRLFKIR